MIGEDGLAKLASARVAVFGLGGVGSACAESLVRAGIGSFLFVDKDNVEPSNLNRQAIAFISTIGRPKTEVMREMALDINPEAQIDTLQSFVNNENIAELMSGFARPDYIVDAIDTLSVKASLIGYAQAAGIPIISAMGGANKTDPTQLTFARLSKTNVCPLCREMRKISRDRGLEDTVVLYSPEQPVKVEAQKNAERVEKTELGTLSYFPPTMGLMIASYVIRMLLK